MPDQLTHIAADAPVAKSYLDRLPPGVAGYVVLALIVWWLTRKTYKDSTADRDQLLDRYETRFVQIESALSNVSQELEQKTKELEAARADLADVREKLREAEARENRCTERMEALEARYEKRIAELEHEIDVLREERSEPLEVRA